MLSFQVTQDGQAIQICCDTAGMKLLMEKLSDVALSENHIHLWGPSFGGTDLSEKTPFEEPAVREVIVTFRP